MKTSHTSIIFVFFCAAAALAAPRLKGPLPPSATLFGASYAFTDATTTFPYPITVPQDGAWFYGNSSIPANNGFMDCTHHYKVTLNPSTLSPSYSPFLTLGATQYDACLNNECFSCSLNWGATKTSIDYTTNAGPGFLPGGSGTAILGTLNTPPNDIVSFGLSQVNMSAMQSMTIYEATANNLPVQASQDDVDSRAYIAASDDRVPLVPRFVYGIDVYPAPPQPNITFTGTWDTGDPANITVTNPYPGHLPGDAILLVEIPTMKTGNHKITITAKLPSGKTFTAPAYQVFVYNAAMETSIAGGAFTTGPANFTRTSDVRFRVAQQVTSGKTLKITKTEWKYHVLQTGVDIVGSDDGLAIDATEWAGTIIQNGTVSAAVTIQSGKSTRISHTAIATSAIVNPRTGSTWAVPQSLCQNCWDDLGTKNGGSLDLGLLLPTDENVIDTLFFASSGTLARGQTGDRLSYENGIRDRDNPSDYVLSPRLTPKPWPLYRPFDGVNDPGDWPNRYSITQIPSGPNRLFWYITQQSFRIAYGYAAVAYFNPTSGPGANSSAYASFVYNSACGNPSDQGCYALAPLTCWSFNYVGQSYFQAASATINPATSTPYNMSLLYTQIQTHEKTRHWDEAVVQFLVDHPEFDLGKMLEQITSRDSTEAAVRGEIDKLIWKLNNDYRTHPQGGLYEVFNDPHTDAPLIEDIPIGTASCALYHP